MNISMDNLKIVKNSTTNKFLVIFLGKTIQEFNSLEEAQAFASYLSNLLQKIEYDDEHQKEVIAEAVQQSLENIKRAEDINDEEFYESIENAINEQDNAISTNKFRP
jgi:hemerythrin-like domain-containing protein